MLGWLRRQSKAEKAPGIAPSSDARSHCSFCRRHRYELARLIVGPGVAICDECVVDAALRLDAESDVEPEAFLTVVAITSRVLAEPDVPAARSDAAVELGIRAAAGRTGLLTHLARKAFDAEAYPAVVRLLGHLPASELSAADGTILALGYWHASDFHRGLEVLDALPVHALREELMVEVCTVSFHLRLERELPEARLQGMLGTLRRAMGHFHLSEIDLACEIAECWCRLGRHRSARDLLHRKAEKEPLCGFETSPRAGRAGGGHRALPASEGAWRAHEPGARAAPGEALALPLTERVRGCGGNGLG